MSLNRCIRRVCLAAAALAACKSAVAGLPHNIILLVSPTLSAASIEEKETPILARLRREGVDFADSHSGFPSLAVRGAGLAAEFQGGALIAAATAAGYSATLDES